MLLGLISEKEGNGFTVSEDLYADCSLILTPARQPGLCFSHENLAKNGKVLNMRGRVLKRCEWNWTSSYTALKSHLCFGKIVPSDRFALSPASYAVS